MSEFDTISDELLACYLDGNCSDAEIEQIETAISTVDDLHVLLLSRSVKSKMDKQMKGLPSFDKGKIIKFEPYVNHRAAGFLGNDCINQFLEIEESDDYEKRKKE